MSRRNRKRRAEEQVQRILAQQVHPLGIGEDPRIAALLQSDGKTATESLEAALAADVVIRGEDAAVKDPEQSERLAKARQRAAEIDAAAKAFAADPVAFATDVLERARRKMPSKGQVEQLKAQGTKMYQQAYAQATGAKNTKRLEMLWHLEHDPKVQINVTGHWTNIVGRGPILMPDEIHISGLPVVRLKPGVRSVPKIVADHYQFITEQRQRLERSKAVFALDENSDQPSKDHRKGMAEFQRLEQEYGQVGLAKSAPVVEY